MKITIIGYSGDSTVLLRCLKPETEYSLFEYTPAGFSIDSVDSIDSSACIVISVADRDAAAELFYILSNSISVKIPIIDFYIYYRLTIPLMKVDRFMSVPGKEYEGMILGLSHSEVGLISELFDVPFCNLSVGSQDLYYNQKAFEYCISNYYQKISKLKYLIIDLYDYTYFNFNTSLSKHFLNYISWGGISFDPHNFDENKNFDISFDDALNAALSSVYNGVTEELMDWWDILFTNPHPYDNFRFFGDYDGIKSRTQKMTPAMIEDFDIHAGTIEKRFSKTMSENIESLRQIILTAQRLNPDINIYCLTIPRYIKLQERLKEVHHRWKEEFYDIIMTLQKELPFKYIDLSNDSIAHSQDNYYDPSHFNMFGAMKFTKLVNDLVVS